MGEQLGASGLGHGMPNLLQGELKLQGQRSTKRWELCWNHVAAGLYSSALCAAAQRKGTAAALALRPRRVPGRAVARRGAHKRAACAGAQVDTMIVQAIGLLDDLDKELNTYAMRVREWFGWHFPEMTKIVSDNIAYAKVVRAPPLPPRPSLCARMHCQPGRPAQGVCAS